MSYERYRPESETIDLVDGAAFLADTNGDGTYDTAAVAMDTNGDGAIDTHVLAADVDGDGSIDAVMVAQDYDGDGIVDASAIAIDQDGDGVADYIATDNDGDGAIDSIVEVDDDGGVIEALSDACFAAGTLISTPAGDVSIESIVPGQQVWSWDPIAEKPVTRPVARCLSHKPRQVARISLLKSEAEILVTENHRVLTNSGWLKVRQLQAGAEIRALDGHRTVELIQHAFAKVPVYNLHTIGEHNYVVAGLIAHNFTHAPKLRMYLHRLFVDPIFLADVRTTQKANTA